MTRPVVLGLTGSIGMGKTTTAGMFADAGCEVWDADAAVHRLYAEGGSAVAPIRALCPEAVVDGAVSRPALKSWIVRDHSALAQIERVVHPLVADDRKRFLGQAKSRIVVLDIPLLFEAGSDRQVDAIVVVSAPSDLQRDRVLARPGMTVAQFETILARQLPDEEKRRRANYIVETVHIATAKASVAKIIAEIERQNARNCS